MTGITYPSSATNSFQYNGLGLRTRKVDSAGTNNYVCDGTGAASPVLADTNATYTPGMSERRGGVSKFLHSDALGTTRGITNSTQTATDGLLFDAFGMSVSRTGTTPTPFGFVGAAQYQTDADSGLQLLGHRYYDPSIGRFISQDPIQDGDNWYAYCGNDPEGCMDPEGLADIIIKARPVKATVGIAYHTFILVKGTDPQSGKYVQYYFSADPGKSGRSMSNAFGNIQARYGPYGPQAYDWPQGNDDPETGRPRVVLVTNKVSPMVYVKQFQAAANRITNAQIGYDPVGPNSNSSARYMLQSVLGKSYDLNTPNYINKIIPGWNRKLPGLE